MAYRLRTSIADGSDDQYDSALFLKSNSFESGVNAQIGNIYQNGLEVSFENSSIGSQFLGFGDGTSSYLENPIHEYDLPGTYVVTLNVLDESNCGVSQIIEIITVTNIEQISVLENEKYNISTYFNPNLESLVVDGLDSNSSYYLTIYNTIGRKKFLMLKLD